MTAAKCIISVATTGSWPRKKDNPAVPVSGEEIAQSIYDCWLEGAAIAHIHVRDEQENPSMNPDYFGTVVKRLREDHPECDIILNFTTSGGVRWNEEQRLTPALMYRPEMASFDCGSMNWQYRNEFHNPPDFLRTLGRSLAEAGIKPEIEVFNPAMIYEALHYNKEGVLHEPLHFQFCMGVACGVPATLKELLHMKECLPPEATWSAFGVGKGAMEILYGTIALGGHVRVGMEDNIRFSKERLADSNAELVRRAAGAIRLFGREVATARDAREILQIRDSKIT